MDTTRRLPSHGTRAGVPAPARPATTEFRCGGFNCPYNDYLPCPDPACPTNAEAATAEADRG